MQRRTSAKYLRIGPIQRVCLTHVVRCDLPGCERDLDLRETGRDQMGRRHCELQGSSQVESHEEEQQGRG